VICLFCLSEVPCSANLTDNRGVNWRAAASAILGFGFDSVRAGRGVLILVD
jgi:hypothetical protein